MNLRPEVWLFIGVLIGGGIVLAIGAWWWLVVYVTILTALLPANRAWLNFLISLCAGAALYAVATLIVNDSDSGLPEMIAELLKLGSPESLFVVVAGVGGLTAGLSALTGTYLRQVIIPARG